MQKIDQIDQQIQKLTQKKKELEVKRAVSLTKALDQVWENSVDEELLLGLLTWAKNELDTSPKQAEVWRQHAPKFRGASAHSSATS